MQTSDHNPTPHPPDENIPSLPTTTDFLHGLMKFLHINWSCPLPDPFFLKHKRLQIPSKIVPSVRRTTLKQLFTCRCGSKALNHKSMASFLPDEIISEILSRLPVKSLKRFKCVCKGWFDLIKNPSFVQIHLQRATEKGNFNLMSNDDGHVYSIDSNDVVVSPSDDEVEQISYPYYASASAIEFLGSCNGLICLSVEKTHVPQIPYSNQIICLWNPATKESIELPYDGLNEYRILTGKRFGFGYDYKTENYKVVMVNYSVSNPNNYRLTPIVKVYTLGSNSWRRIGGIPCLLSYTLPGIFVNGALHWVAKRGLRFEIYKELVVSLDLGDEKYREVPQPKYLETGDDIDMNVGVLEGCLCIIRTNFDCNHVDIWIMKQYGVRESWNKLFTISQSMGIHEDFIGLTPIKILKNGKILLNFCGLMLYDPTNGRVRRLEIRGNHVIPKFDAMAYVGSLISLNSDTFFWPKGGNGASRT